MNQRSGSTDDLGALAPWAQELAQTFVSLSSDIALVLDETGVIQSVAQSGSQPMAPSADQWVGRPWADTVATPMRRKVEAMLHDVASTGLARRREISHSGAGGADIPVAYTAIRLGRNGPVIAVGRDLRAIAAIQQRFLDAQQDLERGYWKARQAESQERQLYQVLSDGVLAVESASLKILRANRSIASRLGGMAALAGRAVDALFDHRSRGAVHELMTSARSSGRPSELRARLIGDPVTCSVAAMPFRAGDEQRLLVRVRSAASPLAPAAAAGQREAAAVADSSGRVITCDASFIALLGARDDTELLGRPVADWLGGAPEDVEALLREVRHEGLAEREAMLLRTGERGSVGVSATWLTEGDRECIGLVLWQTAPRIAELGDAQAVFAEAWTRLSEQLGTTPLPVMLRQATALAEQHFIRIALQRSAGNTQAAASLLGISEQSLVQRRAQDEDAGASP
ncbi:MAG: PAS domain-containing protein [Piscinibacter sp.]|uniref:PAS domain-containing protein n=1 Tax=Piscinibacter sp. TaxID=1903157 RepID=UPI003D0A1FE1